MTTPSNQELNINGTSFPIPAGENRPGFATKLLNDPEVGAYEVAAFLFKDGTFKEYLENKTTEFYVKKLSGNISSDNVQMSSWETKNLKVDVTNTGQEDLTFLYVAVPASHFYSTWLPFMKPEDLEAVQRREGD